MQGVLCVRNGSGVSEMAQKWTCECPCVASRFVFSDSCTSAALANMSSSANPAEVHAAAGEWHYVAIVVEGGGAGAVVVNGRGLHWSTFRLNVSTFCGIR